MKMKKMIPGIKERFNRRKKEVSYDDFTCGNCETLFSGKFCPQCGQSVKDFDKPLSFIFYNFAGDLFAFDSRLLRTSASLLFKPGFLSNTYFKGQRVRHTPPFRIFIFLSFILFLLLQIYTNRVLKSVLNSSFGDSVENLDSTLFQVNPSKGLEDFNFHTKNKENELIRGGIEEISDSLDAVNPEIGSIIGQISNTKSLRQGLNVLASVLEEKKENSTDLAEKEKFDKYIQLLRSPQQFIARLLEYISWAFFLLLPVFALLLKGFYFRKKMNYIKHLIFSVHIHSFLFIIMIIIVGLSLAFKNLPGFIILLLIIYLAVYTVLALKRFYDQPAGKTVIKFLVITFIYNIISMVVQGLVIFMILDPV